MFFTPTNSEEGKSPLSENQEVLPESRPFEDVEMSAEEQARLANLSATIRTVEDAYFKNKNARKSQETLWLNSYRQWRGEHSAEERAAIAAAKARNLNSSDIFIKITKTKVTSALGQIEEVLFAGDKFPLAIESTPEPDGIAKTAFVVPENLPIPADIYGYEGDGKQLDPGATSQSLLGGLLDSWKQLLQGKKVLAGQSPDPKQFPQINPAEETARNMERIILDQLKEGNVMGEIRRSLWECGVYGTGVMKGPLTYENTIHSWVKEDGEIVYKPRVEDTPVSSFVSVWNFYPDAEATCPKEWTNTVEKHLLNRNRLINLKKYKGFDKDAIDRVLKKAPNRTKDDWENIIRDVDPTFTDERYEVLEYWGYLEKEHIENLGKVEKEQLAKIVDQAQVNIWVCDGELLRIIINPFVPSRIPYYCVPYEAHVGQIWGISIPENMKDPQSLMNGHMRMMIDNLKLAGNVILEVNEAQLVPGQDLTIYPGKIFRKQGGAPGQSIYPISFNNTADAHVKAFDKARQLADEATGQPSYAQGSAIGQTGVRTAAQTSMLMQAAAGNVKQVIRNVDEELLKPIGEAYFAWNMQFNKKADIRGDVKILAKGTSALMQKEVQSQRLLQFLQVVSSNQLLTPFANLDYILKQIALSMDLDPDKTVNDPQKAKMVADIIAQMNVSQNAKPGEMPMGGTNPMDMTNAGGGNIGAGSAPQPGMQGFSGNTAAQAAPQAA